MLKCSGHSVSIRDVSKALLSDKFSSEEKIELHKFEWISLLNLSMDRQWRVLIRRHIAFWIMNFNDSRNYSWKIPVISERICNWIMQHNLISKTSDKKFNIELLESLMQQRKFLKRQMYLQLPLLDKLILMRAIMVASAAINDRKTVRKTIQELSIFLKRIDCIESCKTSQEILNALRYFIEIRSIITFYRYSIPEEVTMAMNRLAQVTRKIRHADGGLSIFQSEFTPSSTYVDAVLSHVEQKNVSESSADSNYVRLQSLDGTAFINLRNRYFPLEFSAGSQRVILGTYLYFSNQKLLFSETNRMSHSINREKNNVWLNGKSEFVVNDHEIVFEKRLYINSFGNDIRCEESLSTKSFDVLHCISLPGEIDVSLLEYQNGFFMDMKNGARWMWCFDRSAKFSFDFDRSCILNGEKKGFTLLTVGSDSLDNLRWSLKRI
ncbi:MAG: hypothetical protein LBG20_01015 [Holosporaceae bacterium]|nr:hypothetical protein [Holosporaceae bacterium]